MRFHGLTQQSPQSIYLTDERSKTLGTLREKIGRMDMVLRYVVSGPQGTRESLERLTLYSGEPDPFALAAGLVPANPAIDIGGSGFIHTYRRA